MKDQKNKDNTVEEPIGAYSSGQQLNAQIIWELFRETDSKFKETDKQFRETDKQFKETDKKIQETFRLFDALEKRLDKASREWQEIKRELGGIGNTQGEIAEDYFYGVLAKKLRVGKMTFDQIERNRHRKKKSLEAEFDIVLSDDHKVMVVEVKQKFKINNLRDFHKNKLKRYKSLFPEHKDFKVFGAIAALTFENDVVTEAQDYGFLILTQDHDALKLLNNHDFEPKEIK